MARSRLPDSFPPRLRALIEPHLELDMGRLSSVAQVIVKLRDAAKAARQASGAEEVWLACEEAYVGIDNANRHEFRNNRWAKPMSPDGPLTKQTTPPNDGKSTIFIPITARYVDAGSAKLSEILLPLDDKAFSFAETPVPDIIELKDSNRQVTSPSLGVPLFRDARPGEVAAQNPAGAQPPPAPAGEPAAVPASAGGAVPPVGAAAPPQPPQVPLTEKDLAEEQISIASKKAKKAEKRVYDWMVESQYPAEARKVIFDAARLGVGVLKGPFPVARREVAASKTANGVEVVIRDTVKPGARWVDAWNFFPDPACGENIHNGDHCFERDFFSEHQVRDLLKTPGYIRSQIEAVIAEGPTGVRADDQDKPNQPSSEQRKNQYEIWFFHGVLSRDDYWCICHAAGCPRPDGAREQVFAIVTMINDRVVKAAFNPLDSGALPYHAVPWRRRPGQWAGIGVAEQVSPAQRITNGSMRAMLNNAAKSAGSQIVVNRDVIAPADGQWMITPDKVWWLQSDANIEVDQAFGMFAIPNTTGPLNDIVQLGMRLAEESTNIPLVTQGQSGPTQPDTLGGMQLQNNNANQLLRQIGSAYDDYITEPLVRQYYEFLLLDPDVPDDEKGDYQINAKGSAALVERAIQDQMLGQMLTAALNPAYGLNPKRTMKEFLKSKRFDPRSLENTEEEQKRIDEAPPAAPPQVQVAQIRAASQEKIEGARVEVDRQDVLSDRTVALSELQLRRELAIMDYASRYKLTVEQVKAKLADTSMKLTVQRELSARPESGKNGRVKSLRRQRAPAPQVASPPSEPAGRAAAGTAYQA